MNSLLTKLLAALAGLLAIFGLKWRGDKYKEKADRAEHNAEQAEASNEIKQKQLEEAANRPKDKSDLINRIRNNGL